MGRIADFFGTPQVQIPPIQNLRPLLIVESPNEGKPANQGKQQHVSPPVEPSPGGWVLEILKWF